MSRSAEKIGDDVAKRARTTIQYLDRMERIYSAGHMTLYDLLKSYDGAFLKYHSLLENSIEDLFIGLLAGNIEHKSASVRPLAAIRSAQTARAVVFGGRKYADWLPYNRNTMPRADAFFSRGLPFSLLEKVDRNKLDDMALMRNAIAHESRHAIAQFQRKYTDGKNLPPNQLKPAGYLRGRHAGTQSRINFLMTEGLLALRTLTG